MSVDLKICRISGAVSFSESLARVDLQSQTVQGATYLLVRSSAIQVSERLPEEQIDGL